MDPFEQVPPKRTQSATALNWLLAISSLGLFSLISSMARCRIDPLLIQLAYTPFFICVSLPAIFAALRFLAKRQIKGALALAVVATVLITFSTAWPTRLVVKLYDQEIRRAASRYRYGYSSGDQPFHIGPIDFVGCAKVGDKICLITEDVYGGPVGIWIEEPQLSTDLFFGAVVLGPDIAFAQED